MSKTYTEQELNDLISKVESEFSAHLAKAEEELNSKLAKSEEEAEEKEEVVEAKEESAEKPEEKKEEEEETSEDRPYDEEELELLHKLYAGMSDSEKELHHAAITKCMNKEEKPEEMTKSEDTKSEELSLAKTEIEALKASNEELKKSLETVIETLNKKFVKQPAVAPQRKAITELTVLNKSEESEKAPVLTHKEVVKKLSKMAATPDLKKSDREAINKFCVGSGTLDSIQHLLNK